MVPHTELFANYFLPILDALAKKNIIPGRYAVRLFIFSMERRRQQEIQQLRKKSGKTVLEGEGVKTIEKCKKDSWTRPLQFVLHIYIHSVSSIVQAGWLTDRNSFTLFACLFFRYLMHLNFFIVVPLLINLCKSRTALVPFPIHQWHVPRLIQRMYGNVFTSA